MTRNPPRYCDGQFRRARKPKRARPLPRSRRLLVEWLEERRVLAAVARFDFDSTPSEPGPSGWTKLPFVDANTGITPLPGEIGIKFTSAVQSFAATYVDATIPADARVSNIQSGISK